PLVADAEAAGVLDLDHLGTEVGEEPSRQRARPGDGELGDAQLAQVDRGEVAATVTESGEERCGVGTERARRLRRQSRRARLETDRDAGDLRLGSEVGPHGPRLAV